MSLGENADLEPGRFDGSSARGVRDLGRIKLGLTAVFGLVSGFVGMRAYEILVERSAEGSAVGPVAVSVAAGAAAIGLFVGGIKNLGTAEKIVEQEGIVRVMGHGASSALPPEMPLDGTVR